MLDKNKVGIIFILVVPWVTLSMKVNSQNNRCWCYEYPLVVRGVSFTSSEIVVSVRKSWGFYFSLKQIPGLILN